MIHTKAQIVATLGPASDHVEVLRLMIEHQLGAIRFNFSWGDLDSRIKQIELIRSLEKEYEHRLLIIADLPGPRVQGETSHTYSCAVNSAITERDKHFISFAVEHGIDYVAVSFVGGPEDIKTCRSIINSCGGKQKIIAKIERACALDSLAEIIAEADAVMIARGDLGNEVPLEEIPFVEDNIIKQCKEAGKPVIVATQMLLSMVENETPTRAEVTDVTYAILQGADAVMLSEETAKGMYPAQAVTMMEKIIVEAEKHLGDKSHINQLKSI